jgi:CRP/FNR family transcriptional regulator, cyclic AMP receptor protein
MPKTSEKTPTSICENCNLKQNGFLCHLTPAAAKEFEPIKLSSHYPAGSILFMENEPARGVFLVCSGKVKLSVSSKGGKTLILQMAKPGEVIGLSASMSGVPYEVTAEVLYPSQVVFIRREDFLRFVHRFPEAYEAVIRQLNLQYGRACEQLRTIGLSTTAHEKLARLFLHWSSDEKQAKEANQECP